MYSGKDFLEFSKNGFPIRTSPDQSLFSGSPKLFAADHVLHRHLLPRHPPYALSSLTKLILVVLLNADAVLCADLHITQGEILLSPRTPHRVVREGTVRSA